MDNLGLLPEGCLSVIISFTSPKDAATFSVISRKFMSAAESDVVWKKFLPQNICTSLVYPSKKQLYLSLFNSHILLDGGKLSFWLDKRTGKNCFMVAARELAIAWGDTPEHWEWLSHSDSRFSKVAKLKLVFWLDIRGKIETRILSKRTIYVAYLVFKLEDNCHGLANAKAVVRFVDSESDNEAAQRATLVSFRRGGAMAARGAPSWIRPLRRGDGWMELRMGSFFNDTGEDGAVDARLMEIRLLGGKGGLIVQGVEFRPE